MGLDCLFVSKLLCAGALLQNKYQEWLNYLESTGKRGLTSIKHLEVKEFDWGGRYFTFGHRYEVQNERLPQGIIKPCMLPLMKFMLRLTALRVLSLTWNGTLAIQARQQCLKMDESRAMKQEFLGRHKVNFVGGKAPEVQIRYWDEKQEL